MLPILFQNHDLILYSYPLLMGLGWGVAYQVFFAKADLPLKYLHLLFWGLFFASWIGSKLLFSLTSTSAPSDSLSNASFWTGGGFVFYGGLLFSLVFLLIYKTLRLPLTSKTLWAMLPALTLGHAIGRLGCFLAGCCFGEPTDFWWGIHLHGTDRHPTQLLEAAGLFCLSYYLLKSRISATTFAVYFVGYGLLRFGVESVRGDEIRGLWGLLTPSQWISLLMIFTGIALLIFKRFKGLRLTQ